jgi:hypothetical protein
MQYGTVAELAPKLAEKTKQVLFVPQFKPYQAKGPFVPKYKFDPSRHSFDPVEVAANENFSTASQRSDTRTATGFEE